MVSAKIDKNGRKSDATPLQANHQSWGLYSIFLDES